ncbi:MAG: DUF4340 domain-containing protein [Lentisphaerae bacterium]|nr:DUF4340 domain-containing protein [Lentisphaerota bacterium]
MKKKQLFILLAVGLALILLYLWQQCSNRENWSGASLSAAGSTILPESFNSENVYTVVFTKDGETATLQKGDHNWTMAERYGYPINFASLKTLFVDLYETKVAQTLTLNQNQTAELQLTPDTGAVSMVMLDKEGKQLVKLLFGKKHERETEMPPTPYGGGGNTPIGRFIQINDGDFILAANTFSRVDDTAVKWLDEEFFKISDLKTAILKDNDTVLWEASRSDKNADLTLQGDIPPDQELDSTKLASLKNAFSWVRFQDVADPALPPEKVGLDKAKNLQITDFNDFVYTLTIPQPVEGKQYLKIQVAWQGPLERTPAAEEKPEDKDKADAAFAQSVKEKQDQAKELNARLSPWTYEVEARVVENVNKERGYFLKAKPKPAEETKPAQN